VVMGIDTKGSVITIKDRRALFGKVETRAPHQRAVAENPQILIGGDVQRRG